MSRVRFSYNQFQSNERLDSYLIFILSEVVSLSKTFQRAEKMWVHIPHDHSDQIDHNIKLYKVEWVGYIDGRDSKKYFSSERS